MAAPLKEAEIKRRIAAFEESKNTVPGGSMTVAAKLLGNVSKSALSRFLLNQNMQTDRKPIKNATECIASLKAHIGRFKKIPSREQFNRHSDIGVKWKSHWGTWGEFLQAAGVIGDSSKILLLDIETAPNRAYFWGGTWKVNINPDWIDADGYVLCWTAKWLEDDQAIFHRLKNRNHKALLAPIHELLNQAHAVVHYNGTSFDIPTLNKEFLSQGFTPPSPYKQVDLLLTMRECFRFPNNKLDYICRTLSLGEKLRHEGPQLWMKCMDDDAEAWKAMEEYNRKDIELLEKLYRRLLPWIKKHLNRAALSGLPLCPSCGSFNIDQDGTYLANQLKYIRYKCSDCGVWFRDTKTISVRGEKRFSLTA